MNILYENVNIRPAFWMWTTFLIIGVETAHYVNVDIN